VRCDPGLGRRGAAAGDGEGGPGESGGAGVYEVDWGVDAGRWSQELAVSAGGVGAGAGFESVLGEHWARQVRNYFAEFDKRKRKTERWQVACTS
jgi:hypothetical protein